MPFIERMNMARIKTIILLSLFSIVLAMTCACDPFNWKTPLDYGESKWISEENALIKIEMYVTENKEAYSFVTYNGITKKYKNKFVSEMIYFNNVDEEGNLVLQDGHITGFSAWFDGAPDGVVRCRMDLDKFMLDFLGSNDTQYDEYKFVLTIVK